MIAAQQRRGGRAENQVRKSREKRLCYYYRTIVIVCLCGGKGFRGFDTLSLPLDFCNTEATWGSSWFREHKNRLPVQNLNGSDNFFYTSHESLSCAPAAASRPPWNPVAAFSIWRGPLVITHQLHES
jgi:hypothetical protein